jgi:4'-phosphopantetheinyl transferase
MWSFPPTNLTLAAHEVHVWRAVLDIPLEQVLSLAKLLSEDETLRANRFYLEQHRQRFIVARGTLRLILGQYLGIDPWQLRFEYSSRGKPSLAKSYNKKEIQFNLSHSQGLALYGFTRSRKIGVDLEYLRPLPDAEQIAQRFFSRREFRIISALPPQEKQQAFFRGWTAKEAYLKATGDGLAGSLDRVEVSLMPEEPLHLLSIQGNSQVASRWHLSFLIPATDYVATLAVEDLNWTLRCWQSNLIY